MGKMQILKQKIKGQAQIIKGDIEIAAGEPIHGHLDKARGNANKIVADIKDKADTITR